MTLMYEQHRTDTYDNRTNPDVLELCAIVERCFNFGHTGSSRVIATKSMNALWVGKALIQDGMPSFSDALSITQGDGHRFRLKIDLCDWPRPEDGSLASATSASMSYNYGKGQLDVSRLYVSM